MKPGEEFQLHLEIARAAARKTSAETVILDVGDVLSITGWFVITAGASNRQVRAIAAGIEEDVFLAGGLKIVYDLLLYRAFANSEAKKKD